MHFDVFKLNSNHILVSIAIMYAFIVGEGFYGFGHDYYATYYKSNIAWGKWHDQLGYQIATLTILDIHLGIHITSFILALTSGLLIKDHLRAKGIFSLPLFFLIFVIVIHTWPVIMSTSNAMRQGIAMSFLFVSTIFFARRKPGYFILILLFASFCHKSVLIFFPIILVSYFLSHISKNILFHLIMGLVAFILSLVSIPDLYVISDHKSMIVGETRIISGDYRLPFLIFALAFIILGTLKPGNIYKGYNIFIFYFSFIFPAFYFAGLNWQFERIGMVMLIPYILSFGSFLTKNMDRIYLCSTFITLLVMTFYTGMYASLK
tara:strand:- start:335 stop:1294 length:960 start_codon:yes stop_codon:yes gene_type:complete